MRDPQGPKPAGAKPGKGAGRSSDERLKAALKANMARRKAQAKARAAVPDPQEDDADNGA